MKTESSQARDRLLNDLLSDDLAGLGDDRKAFALAAFRRAHLVRRVRNGAGLVLIVAALAATLFQFAPSTPTARVAETASVPVPAADHGEALSEISDAELISSFPENTCFLAEVDGRKILVFTDEALREKYLHRPGDKTHSGSF